MFLTIFNIICRKLQSMLKMLTIQTPPTAEQHGDEAVKGL